MAKTGGLRASEPAVQALAALGEGERHRHQLLQCPLITVPVKARPPLSVNARLGVQKIVACTDKGAEVGGRLQQFLLAMRSAQRSREVVQRVADPAGRSIR
jgi:hypothetical protein